MTKTCTLKWGLSFLNKFLLFVLLLFFSEAADALTLCNCIEPEPTSVALKKAESVFSGRVKDIEWNGGSYDKIKFEVENSWKKIDKPEKIVLTNHPRLVEDILGSVVGCGYLFEEGEKYLVFTYVYKLSPEKVSRCGRTKKLDEAGEDLSILGKAKRNFKK